MANTEQNEAKIPAGTNLEPAVHKIVTKLAAEDDRSISNTIERLLKQSPAVAELLEAVPSGEPAQV